MYGYARHPLLYMNYSCFQHRDEQGQLTYMHSHTRPREFCLLVLVLVLVGGSLFPRAWYTSTELHASSRCMHNLHIVCTVRQLYRTQTRQEFIPSSRVKFLSYTELVWRIKRQGNYPTSLVKVRLLPVLHICRRRKFPCGTYLHTVKRGTDGVSRAKLHSRGAMAS
jgi:hypothetical protein